MEENKTLDDEKDREITWQPKDFSIGEFSSMLEKGNLELQPEYQRKYVAKGIIASRLIESVLMNILIPSIYLAEEKDNSYSVIDGQQRLTSFLSFLKGRYPDKTSFKLTGLEVFKELNNKLFSEIDKKLQNKITGTTIHTIVIKPESDEDIKFDIFERLNTRATPLNHR